MFNFQSNSNNFKSFSLRMKSYKQGLDKSIKKNEINKTHKQKKILFLNIDNNNETLKELKITNYMDTYIYIYIEYIYILIN